MNSERLDASNKAESLVSYIESRKIAEQLMQTHRDVVIENANNFLDKNRKTIADHLRNIPDEKLQRFVAHGVTKGGPGEWGNVAAFINILQNQYIKGDTGTLGHTGDGWIPAYKKGDFLIVSHADKQLAIRGTQRHEPGIGNVIKIDAGAYVVNVDYDSIVEELRSLFPNKNILKADELSDYIEREAVEKS